MNNLSSLNDQWYKSISLEETVKGLKRNDENETHIIFLPFKQFYQHKDFISIYMSRVSWSSPPRLDPPSVPNVRLLMLVRCTNRTSA
jgi:hypothetical protein